MTMIKMSSASDRTDTFEYRLLFAISFLMLLPVVLVSRLLPRSWRYRLLRSTGRLSIIGETKAAVLTFIPFVFMA